MVGADDATFARLEPVLRCFAENVFHVGGPGAGHTIKLLNNFIAQAICTATAEAFAVGARAGVDLKKLVELVSAGAVNSGLFQAMAKTLDGDLAGIKFELDNARKDIRYYTHLAEGLACRRWSAKRCTSRWCWRARSATARSSCPRWSRRRSSSPARRSCRADASRRGRGPVSRRRAQRIGAAFPPVRMSSRRGGAAGVSSGSAACVASIRSSDGANGSATGRASSLRSAARFASNSALPT